jgi:phenylacetate-CoA ligase
VRWAAQPPSCELPFLTIDGVEGRAEDILTLPGRQGRLVQVHPNVFHNVMDTIPNNGWQIIQTGDGLQVLMVPAGGTIDWAKIGQQLQAALARQGITQFSVNVESRDAIPKAPSGKTPLIKGRSKLP